MASTQPRLYIALYTDEDVYAEVAKQLRARGYDVLSTFEALNMGLRDSDQLEYAVRQERALLTHNIGDYESLHQRYFAAQQEHFGIIVSPQMGIGEIVRRVTNLLDQVDAEQMKNSYRHLGEFK